MGLEAAKRAFDELRLGVSGTKFVIKVWLTTLVPVNINIHDVFRCYDRTSFQMLGIIPLLLLGGFLIIVI